MLLRIGSTLRLKIRHCFIRDGLYYWQRKVPKDLASRYGKTQLLKINLDTSDPLVAARKIERLNRQYESLWDSMRDDASIAPGQVKEQAKLLLKQHRLEPHSRDNDPVEVDHFIETVVEPKRVAYAKASEDPEEAYRHRPEEYLSPVEVEALELLNPSPTLRLSNALDIYLEGHQKRADDTFRRKTSRPWNNLVALIGDKPVEELTRTDANRYKDTELARGLKTGSVRRDINTLRAIFQAVILEKELTKANPFASIRIAGLGEDADEREILSTEQLETLAKACKKEDDDIRWLMALQIDLGGRISEPAGLALSDLVLDHPVPHVFIRPHPWRSLKTKNSRRKIPLVGLSLWAAHRIKETATEGQRFAFPRYTSDDTCKATHAGNTLNQWMRGLGIDRTTHELRHTMRDRLRAVNAPKDIQDAVGGWSKTSIGEGYGEGYGLETLKGWLEKVVLRET